MSSPQNIIDYVEFMNSKLIVHCEDAKFMTDCYKFLEKTKAEGSPIPDIVTYDMCDKMLLFSAGELHSNNDGQYYYEYKFVPSCDIIDNIRVEVPNTEVKLTCCIGGNEYSPDDIGEFLFIAAQYHSFSVRIAFLTPPNENIELTVYSRAYNIIDRKYRTLLTKYKVITNSNTYMSGLCGART